MALAEQRRLLAPQLEVQLLMSRRDTLRISKQYNHISQVAIELLIIILAQCDVPPRRPGVEH
jgi:hypothetical protein